jgi:hypothetical protein
MLLWQHSEKLELFLSGVEIEFLITWSGIHFCPRTNQLFVDHPIIQHYIIDVTDGAIM